MELELDEGGEEDLIMELQTVAIASTMVLPSSNAFDVVRNVTPLGDVLTLLLLSRNGKRFEAKRISEDRRDFF